jgi:hypothetical protein
MVLIVACSWHAAAEEVWEKEIRTALSHNVSFEFMETPLSEALIYFQDLVNVTFVLDPRAFEQIGGDQPVTMTVKDTPLAESLDKIEKQHGLVHVLLDHAYLLTTQNRVNDVLKASWFSQPMTENAPARAKGPLALLDKPMSLEFVQTPISECIAYLYEQTGANIVLDLGGKGDAPVTIRVSQMPAKSVLAWVERLADFNHIILDGAYFVSTPDRVQEMACSWRALPVTTGIDSEMARTVMMDLAKSVTFDFVDTPVSEAVQFLSTLTKMSLKLPPDAVQRAGGGTAVTLRVVDMPLLFALRWCLRMVNLDVMLTDKGLLVAAQRDILNKVDNWVPLPPPLGMENPVPEIHLADWKIKARLTKKMSIAFERTPYSQALDAIRNAAGINIILDPFIFEAYGDGDPEITVGDHGKDAAYVLDTVAQLGGLSYRVVDGAFFMWWKADLGEKLKVSPTLALPIDTPEYNERTLQEALRNLARPVSFDLVKEPVEKVLSSLPGLASTSIVVKDEVWQHINKEQKVSLRVKDMPAVFAIRWATRLTGLDVMFNNNILVIATPGYVDQNTRGHVSLISY